MQERRALSSSAIEAIAERLSTLENLYFPRAVEAIATNSSERKSILFDLLSRNAAVFLERYGLKLTSEELREFDVLNDDYEVNWHLKHLYSLLSPTKEEVRSRSVKVKNRRLAYLNKLISDGLYFSEDAMREREPYLHHEYVGKFQDPTGRSMARTGERWSETLMRRSEEAILIAKIRGEQQKLGIPEKDWIGNERITGNEDKDEEEEEEEDEEEEEEEEEGEEDDEEESVKTKKNSRGSETTNAALHTGMEPHKESTLSAAEIQDLMEQFIHIMQQKFLSGEDTQYLDYSKIDDDETLDDHWMREVNDDAEEKYFAEDDEW